MGVDWPVLLRRLWRGPDAPEAWKHRPLVSPDDLFAKLTPAQLVVILFDPDDVAVKAPATGDQMIRSLHDINHAAALKGIPPQFPFWLWPDVPPVGVSSVHPAATQRPNQKADRPDNRLGRGARTVPRSH